MFQAKGPMGILPAVPGPNRTVRWAVSPAELEVRVGWRTDHHAGGGVERRLERRRDRGERELRGRLGALRRIGVVGGERLDADRVEVAEVAAADRSQTDDGELHAGTIRAPNRWAQACFSSASGSTGWSRCHSSSYFASRLRSRRTISSRSP